MLPYWSLFAFFAIGALISFRQQTPAVAAEGPGGLVEQRREQRPGFLLGLGFIAMLLMVGLRYDVGGDWYTYERIFARSGLASLSAQLAASDPAYQFLNWLVAQRGGHVGIVNLLCAVPFVWGLYRLARLQPEPWLVVVVAIPYMIVVVAMGYTRQAVALGFLMMGLASVMQGASLFRFALYVLLAALFHRTAIVFLPLMVFVFPQSRAAGVVMIVAFTVSLYVLLLQDDIDQLRRNYIEAQYESQGAAIRLAQLALAAVLFFVAGRSLGFAETERRIWRNLSLATLLMVPILLVSPSSTVVDRISLYLLPLQLAVLARFPSWFGPPLVARAAVVFYSGLVLFVWLNYAAHRENWLPYGNYLFSAGGG